MHRSSTPIGVLILLIAYVSAPLTGLGQTKADTILQKTEDIIDHFLYKNYDPDYIASYSDEVALKLLAVSKFTTFKLIDREQKTNIRYRPDRQINLGIGVAYKWFAIDLAFNVGLREDSGLESDFFDFQGRIFSRKQYFEATYQYYFGYQIDGFKNITNPIPPGASTRPDIRTVKVGLHYLYALNYGKFSLKAPFVSNEIQLKSAGSVITGAHFSQYVMSAGASVIPPSASGDFNPELRMNDLNVSTLGVYLGYMYSFVWRRYFVTVSFIPSLHLNGGDYDTGQRKRLPTTVSLGYRTMNAIGYNSRRFFGGLQSSYNLVAVKIATKSSTSIRHGNVKFFVGYRF